MNGFSSQKWLFDESVIVLKEKMGFNSDMTPIACIVKVNF